MKVKRINYAIIMFVVMYGIDRIIYPLPDIIYIPVGFILLFIIIYNVFLMRNK